MTISATARNKNRLPQITAALTFIELLLVIVIIAALTAITIPNLKFLSGTIELDSVSGNIQSYMNYLRERAIVDGRPYVFVVDQESRQYWGAAQEQGNATKKYSIPKGTSLLIQKNNEEAKELLFFPDGEIEQARIILSDAHNKNITLTTEGVFGKVKILQE